MCVTTAEKGGRRSILRAYIGIHDASLKEKEIAPVTRTTETFMITLHYMSPHVFKRRHVPHGSSSK
jgi:hypothetical protein